ncbi:NAD(P)H-dependent glycerol-3-phosphate dehydrogenase [soil metagenome]
MKVSVIGAGAWGTALASVAAENGHDIVMWAREEHVVDEINAVHTNSTFLPDVTLSSAIRATQSIDDVQGADVTIIATPTQFIRSVLTSHVKFFSSTTIVNVAKGIEVGTQLRVSQLIENVGVTPLDYVVVSGPSHAEEVVRRMPTTVVAASSSIEAAQRIQTVLSTETFRVYTSGDVVGVEICGALKNVIAIAAGIVDGIGFGDNTKAALITRGLAEIARLGVALGAHQQTFFGLAGLGDLFVTCASVHSRNRYVGEQIGKGKSLSSILDGMSAVAEGVSTTKAARELAASVGVELPIASKVSSIIFDGEDPKDAIRELMLRPMKHEE